jgi:hypothetical protein
MKLFLKKTVLFAFVAALAVASLTFASASASRQNDPIPQGQITNERLEKIWARQLHRYEQLGRADEFIARVQRLVDRAKANGKDVSAVQAALDVFAAQWKQAKSIYEGMKDMFSSHQGFDSNGKVTDSEKAKKTVLAVHERLQEIKTVLNGTGKALREAIKAYREANPRLQPTATP